MQTPLELGEAQQAEGALAGAQRRAVATPRGAHVHREPVARPVEQLRGGVSPAANLVGQGPRLRTQRILAAPRRHQKLAGHRPGQRNAHAVFGQIEQRTGGQQLAHAQGEVAARFGAEQQVQNQRAWGRGHRQRNYN